MDYLIGRKYCFISSRHTTVLFLLCKGKPEIYWIHFTGNECENILKQYDIKNCYIGERLYLKLLFQDIITELQLKISYEDIVLHNFYILLCFIHRSFYISRPLDNDFSFDRLLLELNSKYANKWSVASMADYCKLSQSVFHICLRIVWVCPNALSKLPAH